MNSYPLRIPISELPDETRLTIPRKAWTLWGTECKVIDIEGEFCRLEFYPEGEEIRRNQEVYIEMPGVSIREMIAKLEACYYQVSGDDILEMITELTNLLKPKTNQYDDTSST